MMLYDVEFSQDGKTFDDYIGDYVKAWNAEEAKDYALTWYIENGGKEDEHEQEHRTPGSDSRPHSSAELRRRHGPGDHGVC